MESEDKKDQIKAVVKRPVQLDQITSPTVSMVGEYKLVKLLGKGSFGHVYLGNTTFMNRSDHPIGNNKAGKQVAIKEIKISGMEAKDKKKVFNEIKILKDVKHPNIIELYEVIETPGAICIVMEYCQGGDLYQYLKEKKQLDENEVQDIVHQVAQGLKEMYKKDIMHRDIKLQNLLRSDDSPSCTIKIADFGLARYAVDYASTICGTLPYMAPEMLKG